MAIFRAHANEWPLPSQLSPCFAVDCRLRILSCINFFTFLPSDTNMISHQAQVFIKMDHQISCLESQLICPRLDLVRRINWINCPTETLTGKELSDLYIILHRILQTGQCSADSLFRKENERSSADSLSGKGLCHTHWRTYPWTICNS